MMGGEHELEAEQARAQCTVPEESLIWPPQVERGALLLADECGGSMDSPSALGMVSGLIEERCRTIAAQGVAGEEEAWIKLVVARMSQAASHAAPPEGPWPGEGATGPRTVRFEGHITPTTTPRWR